MKNIKNNYLEFFALLFPLFMYSQTDLAYHEPSNILLIEKNEKVLDIGINYNSQYKEFQAIYNLNNKFSAFAMYNFNDSESSTKSVFGDVTNYQNNNTGYSLGAGFRNFGTIGRYKILELLVGYEYHKDFIEKLGKKYSSFDNLPLDQSYSKFFLQFNMIKENERTVSAFSLKTSTFKFIENPLYKGQKNIFIAPTYSFCYKILSDKSLVLSSQIGVSVPVRIFENIRDFGNNGYSTQSDYIISGILKFGIQYKFNLKKTI